MQFFFASLACLLGLATAAPSSYHILPRQSNTTAAATTQLTFTGAGSSFSVTAPLDGSNFKIRRPPPPLPPRRPAAPCPCPCGEDPSLFLADRGTRRTPASQISVDTITQAGSANCQFKGVNGAELAIVGANNGATLAPPQTVVSGSCS